ncbi:MAG: DUF362 domain-containing protein [Anaerolineae bacterium]|nr:DUF362 domain-containing protein [Anaerolineae bacterium]
MNRSTVALVRCAGYDPETVYLALKRGTDLLGGLARFVRPGEQILLKPNILAAEGPDKAVTTHPSVLAGCVRLLQEGGAGVQFGDSPGLDRPTLAAKRSGLQEAGLQSGAKIGGFATSKPMSNTGGALVSSFPVAEAVHNCDGIINLPKMKTHQLTRITGAVKNLFGCISGKRKATYHVQFPDVTDFSRLLVELNLTLRPRLHVLDGIVAMEGNGPRSGAPKAMGVLILSEDPVAVDATFCRLVDMNPEFVPTTIVGGEMGLGRYQVHEIEYMGDTTLDVCLDRTFKAIRKPVYGNASYAHYNWIKQLTLPRPAIDPAKCTRCGLCIKACPVPDKALHFADGGRQRPPIYRHEACIRCYCCQEMCPNQAIYTRTPLLGRILQRPGYR